MITSNPQIRSIVLKVAAPCNLNCTYCYEYNRGDSTWRSKPKHISAEVVAQLGRRIAEYSAETDLDAFQVNLHGGEPMLLGPAGIDLVISTLKATPGMRTLRFGMQTNATLATPAMVDVLVRHGVRVGVSLDGDRDANRLRVDHRGVDSWDRTVEGLRLLSDAGLLSGIQACINLDCDPERVLDAIGAFRPPLIELSQPFGNHDNPPHERRTRYSLGDWLQRAFDHWERTPGLREVRVGILADALRAIMTERAASEWFPGAPQGFIVVATDGAYEGLDSLKIIGDEGRVLGMSVHTHTIREALGHEYLQLRANGCSLCEECLACPISRWCAGGYFPTRYGRGRGFRNPSVYCEDLKAVFLHLGTWLSRQEGIDTDSRHRIEARLHALTLERREVQA
jgi:uncharacterized protein